jgi:release factor glutamine methyltransferase
MRIVDVGTGSGAIAIAIAQSLPLAEVTALDVSPAALAIARANAVAHAVGERIRFCESDLLEAVAREARFDAVVSNPPYVPLVDRDSLHVQVRDYEPALALFAGGDGLEVYERLIPQAFAALKPGGLLALEIGYGQNSDLARLLGSWEAIAFVDDLQGIPRVAIAMKP